MDLKNKMLEILVEKYGVIVYDKQLCEIMKVSLATLYRMRASGNCPVYKKLGSKSKNGIIVYNMIDIVEFLTEREK